jgi:hypothetical protein
MQTELLLVVIAKALAELAGMFLIGRGLLYVLTGFGSAPRESNLFWQIICVVTNPLLKAARFVTPRFIADQHMSLVAFALILWIWIGIVFWLLPEMCASPGIDCSPLLDRKRAA